jgi:hypothetical protein
MNLRIGDPESDAQASSVRPGGTVGRTRSAVSDGSGDGANDLGSPTSLGVVVRLSPDARKILAQRDDERAGRAAPDGGAPDTNRAPTSADAGATLGTASSADAPAATGGGGQAGDDKTAGDKTAAGQTAGKADKGRQGGLQTLTPEQKDVVSKLSARDNAVRAHEAAHQAAAGGLGGAASFSYETGPDGKRYAVGGEVPVSLRPGRTPQETIANAQTVRSAALAPADPSPQDLAVAAQASQMEAQARQEITQNGASGKKDTTTGSAAWPRATIATATAAASRGAGSARRRRTRCNPSMTAATGIPSWSSRRSSPSGAAPPGHSTGTCTARVTAAPSARARPPATPEPGGPRASGLGLQAGVRANDSVTLFAGTNVSTKRRMLMTLSSSGAAPSSR